MSPPRSRRAGASVVLALVALLSACSIDSTDPFAVAPPATVTSARPFTPPAATSAPTPTPVQSRILGPYVSESSPTAAVSTSPTATPRTQPSPRPVKKKTRTRKELQTRAATVDCRRQRCVALTFDDGPGPYTRQLVRTLKRADAPATFFMIGAAVDAEPALAREVAAAGFEIGNHSYSHPDLTRLSAARVARQLSRTDSAILRATGKTPALARPPYGAHDARVDAAYRAAGLTRVLWDADTLDWKHRNSKAVERRALARTRPGSIVLMHDIRPTTVRAVPSLVKALRQRGYTLVSVSELLGPPPSRH